MEGDDGDESAPASPNTAGAFRPGRVVWAKVEGHDWWPARIVRRRAVPKEVRPRAWHCLGACLAALHSLYRWGNGGVAAT